MNFDLKNDNNTNINYKEKIHPLVSIIVATYLRDYGLEKAVRSLMNQTYQHIEIIVVDDNADDIWNKKVESIIKGFKSQGNKKIIYIQNKTNKGSAETRNIGIKVASGKYITFLDDDDIYLPNKVENQINHMIENKSDYCITNLELYDENEKLIEKRNRKYIKKKNKNDLLRYHLMYHMTGTDTLMFKKEYLLKIGCFPSMDVGDEFYLIQKAIEAGGEFTYLPLCDVRAYVHRESHGLSSGDNKIKGENTLYEHKKKYFELIKCSDKQYIKMRHYAVLAFTEIRRKKYVKFISYAIRSFVSYPYECIKLLTYSRR